MALDAARCELAGGERILTRNRPGGPSKHCGVFEDPRSNLSARSQHVGRNVPRVSGSYSVCAVAAEGMYSSGSCNNLATMRHSPRDQIFVSGVKRNVPPIDNQGVASLHYDHVFVVFMSMHGGWRCLTTVPKRHLAPVSSVEDIAFDSLCCLICCGDPVCWMLHELREVVHGRLLSHSWRHVVWPLLARSKENRSPAACR